MAVGLGTIDMPVPAVEEWEWLNWKFPRPIHAGDTIYARWTLTQKRPPIGGAPTSIVVWRVDVHTADGTLCAEGEVGAKVRRHLGSKDRDRERAPEAPAARAGPAGPAAPRRRRRRRPAGANGPAPETPAVAAPPAPVVKQERAAGAPRRRRRRRPATGSAPREGEPAAVQAPAPEPAPAAATAAAPAAPRGGLGRVIRRLRSGNRPA
ncbi:MAG TPA: hypothetical protein VN940_00660 [Candidatus Dormibacteraeota bacterium]|nr:hypothetical protein [Candidatus Dormibacteraeota bacterium]